MLKPLQRTITAEVAASDGARDILKRKEIGDFWVSSQSQWGERFWQLDNETAGARAEVSRLHWDVALPDGSCLTDPQWAAQLDAFKRFTWSLFTDENKYYGRPLKPASASLLSTGIGYLARWMIRRNFLSFSELDNAASEVFLDDMADETALADLQPTPIEETMPDHEDDEASGADGVGMSVSQVWRRVSIWLQLWRQAGVLREAGIAALPEPPFNGRSAKQVSRDIATRAASLIPPLPDEVALPIMNAAHRMTGLPAEEVIRLHEMYAEGVQAAINDGQKWRNPQNDRGLRAVKGFQFSVLPGEMQPWHSPLNQAEVNDFWPTYKKGYTPSTVSGSQLLRSLVCSIRDACAIVIQSETGLRVSELCGLEPGIDQESGLPTSVRVRRSYSGLNELFYVDGRLFKTVPTSERVEWLVGSRPVGSKEIPAPVRALRVLTRLLDPWRKLARDPEIARTLFVQPAGIHGMPGKSGIGITYEDMILVGQRQFVYRYVDLSKLPDRNRRGEDLAAYRENRGLRLRTHQWRKTFARYICGTDSRMLPAVSRHFKHLTLAMTEEAYLGKNPALQDAYESNINQSTARILYENARGKPAQAGRMAKVIDEHRAEIQALIANKDERDGRRAIQKWVEQNRLQIFFAPHGKCFVRLDPVGARCHEVGQTVHWLNEEPDYAIRHPSLCAGCSCFLVDKENEEFWLQRYLDNYRAFLQGASAGKASDYRIARERADQAAAILQALKVPLPEV
jgi:integrase